MFNVAFVIQYSTAVLHVTTCNKLKYFTNFVRGNSDAYDTNKMAQEFTHQFLDQAFSVGQQVQYPAVTLLIKNASTLDLIPDHAGLSCSKSERYFIQWINRSTVDKMHLMDLFYLLDSDLLTGY